jgi:hypothetical protein
MDDLNYVQSSLSSTKKDPNLIIKMDSNDNDLKKSQIINSNEQQQQLQTNIADLFDKLTCLPGVSSNAIICSADSMPASSMIASNSDDHSVIYTDLNFIFFFLNKFIIICIVGFN